MRAFTQTSWQRCAPCRQAAMMDTCTLRKWAPTVDNYGTEIAAYTDTTDVDCGLDVTGGTGGRRAAPARRHDHDDQRNAAPVAGRWGGPDGRGPHDGHAPQRRDCWRRRWPTVSTGSRSAGLPATCCDWWRCADAYHHHDCAGRRSNCGATWTGWQAQNAGEPQQDGLEAGARIVETYCQDSGAAVGHRASPARTASGSMR